MGAINISVFQMRNLKLRKAQKLAEGQQLVRGSSFSRWTLAQVPLTAALLTVVVTGAQCAESPPVGHRRRQPPTRASTP